MLDAPNGTDAGRIVYTSRAERRQLRARVGLDDGPPLVLFMGSGHWPNIDAAKRVFEFSAALPHVAFLVMGSVSYAFDPRLKPENVLFLGEVDDVARNLCLQACDVSLNPMERGSGTNLKLIEYLTAGIPVLSTPFGARGTDVIDGEHLLLAPPEGFARALSDLLADPDGADRRAAPRAGIVPAVLRRYQTRFPGAAA